MNIVSSSRPPFVRLFAVLFTSLSLSVHKAESGEKAQSPNILIVITDDQGYGDFSLHGNPHLSTPSFDEFATNGIQFSNFHVSPFCAPTRASLLTGRYSLRTGAVSVTGNREVMKEEEVTLAEILKSLGYRTGCFGKWHNGEQFPHDPIGQGFDEFFGFNGGHINDYFDAELLRGSTPEPTHGYITDVLVDEAIRFIRKDDTPFFCYLSLNAPHTPVQVPVKYTEKFTNAGLDKFAAGIYGMCESIDESFGRILEQLDEAGIREDTLVMFLTDNGANGGDRFNAGMRGYKGSVHEGGTRVPLVMQWPKSFPHGTTVSQLSAHIDIVPTLLDLLGQDSDREPEIDGISLEPWINSPSSEEVDRDVFIYRAFSAEKPFPGAVRTARWRLVCEETRPKSPSDVPPSAWQLYDMDADPSQQDDLSDSHPTVVASLAKRYVAWWQDLHTLSLPAEFIHVGEPEYDRTTIHAPQLAERKDIQFGVRRLGGRPTAPGFCQDWIESWTSPNAYASWNIDIKEAGIYEISVEVNVPRESAGSEFRVSIGDQTIRSEADVFEGELQALQRLVPAESTSFVNYAWDRQSIGKIAVEEGEQNLKIQISPAPDQTVPTEVWLKSITFTKSNR